MSLQGPWLWCAFPQGKIASEAAAGSHSAWLSFYFPLQRIKEAAEALRKTYWVDQISYWTTVEFPVADLGSDMVYIRCCAAARIRRSCSNAILPISLFRAEEIIFTWDTDGDCYAPQSIRTHRSTWVRSHLRLVAESPFLHRLNTPYMLRIPNSGQVYVFVGVRVGRE